MSVDENPESLLDKPVFAESNLPDLPMKSNHNAGVGELFYKMILMVLAVVVFGAVVVYLSKKLLPKLTLPGKQIHVTETVHLGPHKSIHLVTVGEKTLLIGSTNESITHLADVTDQMPEVDFPEIKINDN